mmetsp:Transcript_21365/g.63717  ORF Transcript_21365/g.63717 Transcript_21365/m.63717 type:complete len:204 (+) Transcript_21365:192-803(+)
MQRRDASAVDHVRQTDGLSGKLVPVEKRIVFDTDDVKVAGDHRTWSKSSETSTQPPETPEIVRLRGFSVESASSSPRHDEGPLHVVVTPSLRGISVDGEPLPKPISSRLLTRRRRRSAEDLSSRPPLTIDLSVVPAAEPDAHNEGRGPAGGRPGSLRADMRRYKADVRYRGRELAASCLRDPVRAAVQALSSAACYICADELV